jgi:hypothetical protein
VLSPELEIMEVRHAASAIVMKWCLRWGMVQPNIPREITVSVDSEAGPITFETWVESGLGAFPFRLESPRISSAIPSVKSMEVAHRTGVRLTVGTASIQPGLMLEGELHVRMTESGGKLLRPVIGVRISDANGVAE